MQEGHVLEEKTYVSVIGHFMDQDGEPTHDGGVWCVYDHDNLVQAVTHFETRVRDLCEDGQTFDVLTAEVIYELPRSWGDRELASVNDDGI